MIYTLTREQFVPRPLEEVFAFFCQAENLDRLTPPWMHFRIRTPLPITMTVGTHIDYRIYWRWLPVTWKTEITTWNPPYGFVDEQRKGPYKLWHHTHEFQPVQGGTLMTDTVRYAMRFGPLGTFMHWLTVRRDIETIFAYRRQQVEAIFGKAPVPEMVAA